MEAQVPHHERGALSEAMTTRQPRDNALKIPPRKSSQASVSSDASVESNDLRVRLLPSRQASPQLERGEPTLGARGSRVWPKRFRHFADANQGVALMILAQLFAAAMAAIARLLEVDKEIAMHPFQVSQSKAISRHAADVS